MEEEDQISLLSDDQNEVEPGHRKHRKTCCKVLPLASCVAALGGVLFGYDIGIISGALLQLKDDFKLSCSDQEIVVTSLIVGGLVASVFGGQIVDYFGRRKAIIANSFFFVGGAVILAFSQSFGMLIIGRLFLGFAVSLSAIGECIYISEIAPPAKRGSLVSLNELGITLGILIAYLVNYFLIQVRHGWRMMFGLSSIPALLQGVVMIFLPSSPRWLVSQKKEGQAVSVIRLLWPTLDVQTQLEKFKQSLSGEKSYKLSDLVGKKQNMRLRMFIGSGIVFFQQITGQPTVLYYAPAVFLSFGFTSSTSATLATVGLGIVKVAFTAVALLNVDKLGRRLFLLIGAVTMTTSVIILSAVTQPIHQLHTQNPCDKNFIGAGHTYLSHPNFYQTKECIKQSNMSHASHNISLIPSQMNQHPVATSASFLNTSTPVALNCTEFDKRRLNVHEMTHAHGSVKYVCLLALMAFVAGYAIGYGPMSWLFLTEIFPVGIKGRAVAMATIFNWGTNIIISMTFLEVIGTLGPSWTFLIYSIFGVFSIIFIYHFVPETKQKTLEQISQELNKRSVFCMRNTSGCLRSSQRVAIPLQEEENSDDILINDSAI